MVYNLYNLKKSAIRGPNFRISSGKSPLYAISTLFPWLRRQCNRRSSGKRVPPCHGWQAFSVASVWQTSQSDKAFLFTRYSLESITFLEAPGVSASAFPRCHSARKQLHCADVLTDCELRLARTSLDVSGEEVITWEIVVYWVFVSAKCHL